jgi:hypothetical protein
MELTRSDGSTYRVPLAKARTEAVQFTVSEFAVALTTSQYFAKSTVDKALALCDDLPAVWAALNRGEISEYRARMITDEVACLDPDTATTVADEILPAAPGYTPAELKAALRHAVLKADPDAAFQRYAKALKNRRVTTRIDQDAMAWFSAYLTGAEMTRLMAIIDAHARAMPEDNGTLDNRRADALIGLVERGSALTNTPPPVTPQAATPEPATPQTGTPEPATSQAGTPEPAAPDTAATEPTDTEPSDTEPTDRTAEETDIPADQRPDRVDPLADSTVDPFQQQLTAQGEPVPTGTRLPEGNPFPGAIFGLKPNINVPHVSVPHVSVNVTIGAGTLLGLDNEPGYLAGYGHIPAPLSRHLAADATWRRMITDPASGTLLDLGHTTYKPSQRLREHVQERDQTCRYPGCQRKARGCDIDHATPWPIGTTSKDNLHCLCSYHHKLKTRGGWNAHLQPDGTCLWTSPTGRQWITRPPKPGGICPPTEAKPAPTIPSRTELLRDIAGLRPPGNTPQSTAGEPPF